MEERAVPAVGRRARTPATFMVVDMSRACGPVSSVGAPMGTSGFGVVCRGVRRGMRSAPLVAHLRVHGLFLNQFAHMVGHV